MVPRSLRDAFNRVFRHTFHVSQNIRYEFLKPNPYESQIQLQDGSRLTFSYVSFSSFTFPPKKIKQFPQKIKHSGRVCADSETSDLQFSIFLIHLSNIVEWRTPPIFDASMLQNIILFIGGVRTARHYFYAYKRETHFYSYKIIWRRHFNLNYVFKLQYLLIIYWNNYYYWNYFVYKINK